MKGVCYDRDVNSGFYGCEPSALLLSYPAIPITLLTPEDT